MAYFLKNKKLVIISLIIIFLAFGFAFLMVLGRQTDRNFIFNNEETGLISVPNGEFQPDQVNNFQVFQFPKTPLYNEGNLTGDFVKGVVNDIVEKNPYGSLPQGGYDSALLVGNPVETFHSVVSDYYKEVIDRENQYLSQLKTSREKDSGSQLKYLNNIFLSNTRNFGRIDYGSDVAITEFLEKGNSSKLKIISRAYKSMLEEILTLQVPTPILDSARSYIKSVADVNIILSDLLKFEADADPLRGMSVLTIYKEAILNQGKHLSALYSYAVNLSALVKK